MQSTSSGDGPAVKASRGARAAATALAALLGIGIGTAAAQTPDPSKDFFGNYLTPPYFMPVSALDGQQFGGDLTAVYDQAYIANRANRELLIVGEYPRARFFSITLYDDHGAVIATLHDSQINPLRPSTQVNPYRPGGPAGAEDILYAVRVRLGDGLVTTPAAGCGFPTDFDAASNLLDGRFRHTAGTRYSPDMSNFTATSPDGTVTVAHDDASANKSVAIVVRRYLEDKSGGTGAFDLTRPVVFVRNTTSGCALNVWTLAGLSQPDPAAWLPPSAWFNFHTTADAAQIAAHTQHAKDAPIRTPSGLDPNNRFAWYGGPEYILTTNPHTGYLSSAVPEAGKPATLNSRNKVMRMRFRLPTMPCHARSCPLTGTEEMRYWGLSFVEGERTVTASVSDLDLNPDANGYVTLILSFGTVLPPHVTAANGYSIVALPAGDPRLVTLRNILPAPNFPCSIDNVPFKTNEHNANGGYMGQYVPFVDFPFASQLPPTAVPFVQAGNCELPAR